MIFEKAARATGESGDHRPDLIRPRHSRTYLNLPIISGALILIAMLVAALLVPWWSDYGPREPDAMSSLLSPSRRHLMGTDQSGFDMFTRVVYAARLDIPIAFAGVALGIVAGVVLGVLAGYSRGAYGEVVMRLADLVQAFPLLILAMVLVALSGNNMGNLILALAFLNLPIFLRLVRSRVLSIRELRYVEASIALGNHPVRLAFRHILPNAIGPVIVQAGISVGYGVLTIAGLAFLGVGVQAPEPEWGSMILSGIGDITTGHWWTVVFPGLGLILAVTGFNLLSEGFERARSIA